MEHIPIKYGYARESTNEAKQNIDYQINHRYLTTRLFYYRNFFNSYCC